MAISKLILNGETQMDVTSNTNTSNNMLNGVVGTKNDGTTVTGSITTKTSSDLTASGATVTAPAGYYSTAATKSIAAGSAFPPAVTITKAPTIGVNTSGIVTASYNGSSSITPTVNAGYVSQGTAGTISTTGTSTYQLTSKAAATYYPSTADQTIASQRWLVGNQTIKSVTTSNLTAANIAEGVVVKVGDSANASRITQITGTHISEPTYTATINGNGQANYCYVTYSGTKYYSNNQSFTFKEGDTLTIHCSGKTVKINKETIEVVNSEYTYTLPVGDINIALKYNSSQINSITISGLIDANSDPIYTATISGNGSSGVRITYKGLEYDNNVLKDFTYKAGETCVVTVNSYNPNYPNTKLIINGETIVDSNDTIQYTYTLPNKDISIFVDIGINPGNSMTITESTIPSGTLSITSNGTHNVYGYNSVNVNSTGEYYEAYKRIALKSSISSSNTDIVSYFNTISSIKAYQFEDIYMSGSFTFPVCTIIGDGGFQHTDYNHCYFCTFDFPEVESIGLFAFKLQSRLTSINAPKATVIKTQAFMSCTSLQTVNFPKVTSIGSSAFYACQALTTVSFPEALYIYTSAFCSCNNLSSISFPKVSQIDSYAFRGCYSLTTANFPSATSIGISAFHACRNLSSISFPNTTDIGVDAFHSCSNLTTADFPSATIINDSAFYNCTSLTTINAPAVTSIGGYVFTNCSSLLSIDFPQVSIVGTQAFHSCINLSIARFSKLTSISAYAFRYCYNLLSLYLLGSSVVSLGTTALAYTPISNYTTSTGGVYGSIFVPSSLYNSYLTATNWSVYSSRFVSV